MKISVITVCLNSVRTIEKTIQSVIGQNYANYEYIVIDGGSTDGTLNIIRRYEEKISILVSEPDQGIYDAMNKGIALATGDVIGIINSDDWYEPDTLVTVENGFQKSDAEIIYGSVNNHREKEKSVVQIPDSIERLRYEMAIPHPTVFIKKEVYKKYGSFRKEYRIAADHELLLRLYTRGVRFLCMDRILANFRYGGISERQGKLAAWETLKTAMEYLPYAPLYERKEVKDIIYQRFTALWFDEILDHLPTLLIDTLSGKLGVGAWDKVVIFGAGNWGMKLFDILSLRGMMPIFLVDNDAEKWHEEYKGYTILSPESLKTFQGVLLVMVKEASKEILSQVEKFCNSELYVLTWVEIAVSCMVEKICGESIAGRDGEITEHEKNIYIGDGERESLFRSVSAQGKR